MNDRLPGASYDNPIWRGKWRIYLNDSGPYEARFAFVHDDYDGAEDSGDKRCGYAETQAECERQIDELEAGE